MFFGRLRDFPFITADRLFSQSFSNWNAFLCVPKIEHNSALLCTKFLLSSRIISCLFVYTKKIRKFPIANETLRHWARPPVSRMNNFDEFTSKSFLCIKRELQSHRQTLPTWSKPHSVIVRDLKMWVGAIQEQRFSLKYSRDKKETGNYLKVSFQFLVFLFFLIS